MQRPLRVSLLTPYTGDNLGDAAIQEAIIGSLLARNNHADICLITYSPTVTSRVHRVRSFPIGITMFAPGELREYEYVPSTGGAVEAQSIRFDTARQRIKARFPYAGRLKRALLAWIPPALKALARDAIHSWRAFRLTAGTNLVVVSGGGQIDDYWGGAWRQPYALLKWGILARLRGARYVFLSVGTGSLESRVSRVLVHGALRLANYRSYRDQVSKTQLARMSFTRSDPVYPDLAFGFSGFTPQQGRTNGRPIVGISPIAYLSRRWPTTNLIAYEAYIANMAAFARDLVRKGYDVTLFSTDRADLEALDDLEAALARLDLVGAVRREDTTDLTAICRCFASFDFCVASRLHGVILSHRAGLPVLAISYDRKVDTHMAEVGMTEYCASFHGLANAALQRSFDGLVANAVSVRSALRNVNTRYTQALEEQYDTLLGAYGTDPANSEERDKAFVSRT
jgi:polysaccharide pyruvyl transferase WcaK-like protein